MIPRKLGTANCPFCSNKEAEQTEWWKLLSILPFEQDWVPLEHIRRGHPDYLPNCSGCTGGRLRQRQHRREQQEPPKGILFPTEEVLNVLGDSEYPPDDGEENLSQPATGLTLTLTSTLT